MTAWTTCEDCGGSGEITRFARWRDEGNGGEYVGAGPCENCDGLGGWEDGAPASPSGSRPTDRAPTGLAASRINPSRKRAA